MPTSPVPVSRFTQQARVRIGEAIYLLGYLIHSVDWTTGAGHFTLEGISRETGYPITTLKRWMDALREAGEVITRRTMHGTHVTITDYDEIAATRKVKRSASHVQPAVRAHGPDPERQSIKNGPCHGPLAEELRTESGLCNIEQIPFQNREKSLQSDLLHSGEGTNENLARGQAQDALAALSAGNRAALRRSTLQEMASSEKRYLQVFVRRDESGELDTYDPAGERVVEWQMVEKLNTAAPAD